MAFNKKQKKDMLAQYEEWLRDSQAVYLMSFDHMSMSEIDTLRAQVREAGGTARIVKNTLLRKALKSLEMELHEDNVVGTTLAGFAFEDAPALAKTFTEATKTDIFSIKYGYLDGQIVNAQQIKALADLPPMPVMRAMLLSTILAPATKFVRTLAEPARSLAAVTKAYSEKGAAA
ncbi:MAG: 50S ribosomal protein L10 [Anaerolineaceae bacterium]|nr:50S ribosomal protein L10 [Anaerolineaceae bacterium]